MTSLLVATSEDMEAFGRWLGGQLEAGDIVVLTGPLGAGKTTLTRGIGEALGLTSPIQSPTFIVAREHQRTSADQPPLVHVDAYRIGSAAEFDDLDIDWAGSIAVVEWGRPFVSAVAGDWIDVEITPDRSDSVGLEDTGESDHLRHLTLLADSIEGTPSAHLQSIVEASRDFGH
jgi:tRNA threonylcarbamoyl adenosine modification protein YjeE